MQPRGSCFQGNYCEGAIQQDNFDTLKRCDRELHRNFEDIWFSQYLFWCWTGSVPGATCEWRGHHLSSFGLWQSFQIFEVMNSLLRPLSEAINPFKALPTMSSLLYCRQWWHEIRTHTCIHFWASLEQEFRQNLIIAQSYCLRF